MSQPRADFTALRSKVADAIKYASGPISSNEIGKAIGHVAAEGDPFKNYAITSVIGYMRSRNWLDVSGKNHGTRYKFNANYKDELNPLSNPQAHQPHPTAPKEKVTPVVMVEVPRCTLKLLVKHALGNSPLEPVLQRAVMQCVEKLL